MVKRDSDAPISKLETYVMPPKNGLPNICNLTLPRIVSGVFHPLLCNFDKLQDIPSLAQELLQLGFIIGQPDPLGLKVDKETVSRVGLLRAKPGGQSVLNPI